MDNILSSKIRQKQDELAKLVKIIGSVGGSLPQKKIAEEYCNLYNEIAGLLAIPNLDSRFPCINLKEYSTGGFMTPQRQTDIVKNGLKLTSYLEKLLDNPDMYYKEKNPELKVEAAEPQSKNTSLNTDDKKQVQSLLKNAIKSAYPEKQKSSSRSIDEDILGDFAQSTKINNQKHPDLDLDMLSREADKPVFEIEQKAVEPDELNFDDFDFDSVIEDENEPPPRQSLAIHENNNKRASTEPILKETSKPVQKPSPKPVKTISKSQNEKPEKHQQANSSKEKKLQQNNKPISQEKIKKPEFETIENIEIIKSGATIEPANVFICYSRQTKALYLLNNYLYALGVNPIMVMHKPNASREVSELAISQMKKCECAIILATGDLKTGSGVFKYPSNIVIKETMEAVKIFNKKIIYLLEENAKFPENMKPNKYESFKDDNLSEAFIKIVHNLREFDIIH